MDNILKQVLSLISKQIPSSTLTTNYRPVVQAAQPQIAQSQSTSTPQGLDKDLIRQNIIRRYKENTPILKDLDLLIQAGKMLENQKLDPLLPIIMALRETQGGKDLLNVEDVKRKYGTSNIYNIKNVADKFGRKQTGNEKPFVNYPDIKTAVLGGPNQDVISKGLVGMLLNSPQYAPYRQSGNIGDLLNVYSPPGDNNGPLYGTDERAQVPNYEFIRNELLRRIQ